MEIVIPRESKTVELKQEIPQKNQLVKTCVAFANGAGGEIIIGVEDNTQKILGVSDKCRDKIFDSIANTIIDSVAPHLIPEIYEKNISGKRIIIIKIYPGNKPPYFIAREGN
jgi:predicted HTH transcriptional regulator